MDLVDTERIKKDFPYLSGTNLESAILNDGTLCVTLTTSIRTLKELVSKYNWQCIFDQNVDENQEIFTCIVKKL
ncbi:MAG: hypothetical protein ACP5QT_03495 [Brevinematia bacterium]